MGEFELYRFNHHDGSSKDWAIRDNRDGSFTTRWGKTSPRLTGEKTRRITVPDEVDILKRAKSGKGYIRLGTVGIDSIGNLTGPVLGMEPVASASQMPSRRRIQALYWTLELDAPVSQPVRSCLVEQIQNLTGRVQALAGQAGDFANCEHDSAEPANALNKSGKSAWDGWAKLARLVDLLQTTGLSGKTEAVGQVRKEQGIIPLLFLVALRDASLPGLQVGIASEAGHEIGDLKSEGEMLMELFGTGIESVRPLAEALGLVQPKIDLSAMAGEDFFF